MNKLIFISIAICTFILTSVNPGKAQVNTALEVSTSAMLSVSIVVPIAATESSQLNFGRFYPGDFGGTITVSPQGFVTTTSGVVIAASFPSAGMFSVSGQGDATYAILLPDGPSVLTSDDGSTMQVYDWVSFPENGDARVRLVGGLQTVSIGATLRVGTLDQNPRGLYNGSYVITFGYN